MSTASRSSRNSRIDREDTASGHRSRGCRICLCSPASSGHDLSVPCDCAYHVGVPVHEVGLQACTYGLLQSAMSGIPKGRRSDPPSYGGRLAPAFSQDIWTQITVVEPLGSCQVNPGSCGTRPRVVRRRPDEWCSSRNDCPLRRVHNARRVPTKSDGEVRGLTANRHWYCAPRQIPAAVVGHAARGPACTRDKSPPGRGEIAHPVE